jgi:hypothetical protein
MKKYIIITGSTIDIEKFAKEVNEAIEEGYELAGPLATPETKTREAWLLQPMVYKEAPPLPFFKNQNGGRT